MYQICRVRKMFCYSNRLLGAMVVMRYVVNFLLMEVTLNQEDLTNSLTTHKNRSVEKQRNRNNNNTSHGIMGNHHSRFALPSSKFTRILQEDKKDDDIINDNDLSILALPKSLVKDEKLSSRLSCAESTSRSRSKSKCSSIDIDLVEENDLCTPSTKMAEVHEDSDLEMENDSEKENVNVQLLTDSPDLKPTKVRINDSTTIQEVVDDTPLQLNIDEEESVISI